MHAGNCLGEPPVPWVQLKPIFHWMITCRVTNSYTFVGMVEVNNSLPEINPPSVILLPTRSDSFYSGEIRIKSFRGICLSVLVARMSVVAEVAAFVTLAASFLNQLQKKLYTGSAALTDFRIKVFMLSTKQAEWSRQLRRRGMLEDPALGPLVREAAKILKEQEAYNQKFQTSRLWRLKTRAFPAQLTTILDRVLEIVDAGKNLLENRVATNALLDINLGQIPSILGFGPDIKYVPISHTIQKVKAALENDTGPRVVSVSGMPGIGKTSLVKHIALAYQQQLRQMQSRVEAGTATLESQSKLCFLDGVFFLECGKGASNRRLHNELLQKLGCGTVSAIQATESLGKNAQEKYVQLPSYKTILELCLASQRLLIVLDAVWDTNLLEKFLIPGDAVKYLITSQNNRIWEDAINFEMEPPTLKQARQIMASHSNMHRLPSSSQFSDVVQVKIDAIIKRLGFHPLSIANIAASLNRKGIYNPSYWDEIWNQLYDRLDDSIFYPSPLLYEVTYPLSVAASMVLMIDSLPTDACHLLFTMALCKESYSSYHHRSGLPEAALKYFFKFLQPSSARYVCCREYLENRSLIDVKSQILDHRRVWDLTGNEEFLSSSEFIDLTMHALRRHFIEEKKTEELQSTAMNILGWGTGAASNWSWDDKETLRFVVGSMFGGKIFIDVIVTTVETHFSNINAHAAPWISSSKEALDLVKRAPYYEDKTKSLLLLVTTETQGGWTNEASDLASKIILRLICKEELDDNSMARLLEFPHTTAAACRALHSMRDFIFTKMKHAYYVEDKMFSSAYPRTMQMLMQLLNDNSLHPTPRAAVVRALEIAAEYETEMTILGIAEIWAEILAKTPIPALQIAIASVFSSWPWATKPRRIAVIMGACPGILEGLLNTQRDTCYEVRSASLDAIGCLSFYADNALRIASISGALEKILSSFASRRDSFVEKRDLDEVLINIACNLSRVAEIRNKCVPFLNRRLLEGLACNLNPLKPYATRTWSTVKFLGNVGLEPKARETIMTMSSIEEGLRNIQEVYARNPSAGREPRNVVRTLTILSSNGKSDANKLENFDWGSESGVVAAHLGRADALEEMGLFSEAIEALDRAQGHLRSKNQCSTDCRKVAMTDICTRKIYLRSKSMTREQIHREQNSFSEEEQSLRMKILSPDNFVRKDIVRYAAERAVLRRMVGDWEGALVHFEVLLERFNTGYYTHDVMIVYYLLRQRGFVKHLLGDNVGAKADAESALHLNLKSSKNFDDFQRDSSICSCQNTFHLSDAGCLSCYYPGQARGLHGEFRWYLNFIRVTYSS